MTDSFCQTSPAIRLRYRALGDATGRPIVFVAGLGLDLTAWPPALLDGVVRAGHRVVLVDNRDAGQSTKIATAPPSRLRMVLRRPRRHDYHLGDMADDVVGLLDHLSIERADVVGMSMGGMIGQIIAARHASRVRSLVSIFSTTGSLRVGQPALSTMVRLAAPPSRSAAAYADTYLRLLGHIASSEFPVDRDFEHAWALRNWEQQAGRPSASVARQIAAVYRAGDRTSELRGVVAPTLVIHGDRDRMVHPSGGRATAAAIANARHVVVKGMRHHLAPSLAARLTELIADHTSRGFIRG